MFTNYVLYASLFQIFTSDPYPFVTFDKIPTWKHGSSQKFHYSVRCGIEPDTSPWDWIGLFPV